MNTILLGLLDTGDNFNAAFEANQALATQNAAAGSNFNASSGSGQNFPNGNVFRRNLAIISKAPLSSSARRRRLSFLRFDHRSQRPGRPGVQRCVSQAFRQANNRHVRTAFVHLKDNPQVANILMRLPNRRRHSSSIRATFTYRPSGRPRPSLGGRSGEARWADRLSGRPRIQQGGKIRVGGMTENIRLLSALLLKSPKT